MIFQEEENSKEKETKKNYKETGVEVEPHILKVEVEATIVAL
jgi:hypothetical protein